MPNHYHLFIKTIDPNLSIGIRQLNGNYAQRSNIRLGRYGHLFQGRFKSILVESEAYQGNLVRYITLNPVRAKLAKSPVDWPWSSHREIMGKTKPSGCVHPHATLGFFHPNKTRAREEYVKHLKEKCDYEETWKDLRSGLILGSMEFARDIIEKYGSNKSCENIKNERFAGRPSLESIFPKRYNQSVRYSLIIKAFREYGYTRTEIGNHLKIHYTTVSKIIGQGPGYWKLKKSQVKT